MRALLVLLAACNGTEGTISVGLTQSPGSTLLDGVQTLHVTLTNPDETHDIARDGDGFAATIDIPTDGEGRALRIDGLDAGGATIAVGRTPVFPVNAITATVIVFMAPPMSLTRAPHDLAPARASLAATPLTYGAIFVGGEGTGADAVSIYNAYDHSLLTGLPLPAPRAHACLAATRANDVFIFTDTLWRFSTSTPPMGAYTDLGAHPEFARDCSTFLPARVDVDRFVIPGTPALEVSGVTLAAREDVTAVAGTGASITTTDGVISAIFAGQSGVVRFRNNVVDTGSGMYEPGTIAIPDPAENTILIHSMMGFTNLEPIRFASTDSAVATVRVHPAMAATSRFVVVAGGVDAGGSIIPTADIYDAKSLVLLTTIPMVIGRTDAHAIALPNEQILIVGGVDALTQPIPTIELFTPPSP